MREPDANFWPTCSHVEYAWKTMQLKPSLVKVLETAEAWLHKCGLWLCKWPLLAQVIASQNYFNFSGRHIIFNTFASSKCGHFTLQKMMGILIFKHTLPFFSVITPLGITTKMKTGSARLLCGITPSHGSVPSAGYSASCRLRTPLRCVPGTSCLQVLSASICIEPWFQDWPAVGDFCLLVREANCSLLNLGL